MGLRFRHEERRPRRPPCDPNQEDVGPTFGAFEQVASTVKVPAPEIINPLPLARRICNGMGKWKEN
jgi:hypothetical protein